MLHVCVHICLCGGTCLHMCKCTWIHVHVEDQSWCFLQFLLIPWDRVSQWSPEHLCMSSLDCQFVLRIPYYHLPGLKTQVVCLAWEAFIGVLDIGTLVLTLTNLTNELSPLPQVFFKQITERGQPLPYWPRPWESPRIPRPFSHSLISYCFSSYGVSRLSDLRSLLTVCEFLLPENIG